MSSGTPTRTDKERSRRRTTIILLIVSLLFVFAVILAQTSFDLPPFLNPDTNQQLLFFATLSAVVFLLFVALTFILARNLLKLFAERRLGVLGSILPLRGHPVRVADRPGADATGAVFAAFRAKRRVPLLDVDVFELLQDDGPDVRHDLIFDQLAIPFGCAGRDVAGGLPLADIFVEQHCNGPERGWAIQR